MNRAPTDDEVEHLAFKRRAQFIVPELMSRNTPTLIDT